MTSGFLNNVVYAKQCLYISSYHPDYVWDMGQRRGLEPILKNHCELKTFFMDTKRNKGAEFAQKKALEAKALIESWQPDVIIAADDNASRYLVKPYFRDAKLPIVFCGVNFSVKEYGFPYKNVTGIIEVEPFPPLLKEIKTLIPNAKNGVFLAADVPTQHKVFKYFDLIFQKKGIATKAIFVKTLAQWQQAYKDAQSADFIYIGNSAGINDWNEEQAVSFVMQHSKHKFVVTTYPWMLRLAMLAFTKVPEEQGEWAAKVALRILQGERPDSIPIVANRKWNLFVNKQILDSAGLALPRRIMRKAQYAK